MREAVRALYERGLSQREVAEELGVCKSTVAFHIRRLDQPPDERFARRYDWDLIRAAYDSGLSFRQCRARFGFTSKAWSDAVARRDIVPRPRSMPIELLLVGNRPYTKRSHLKQRLIEEGMLENRCAYCGLTEWRGRPLTMQLHHKNGVGKDNRIENLELLCANCHSQTDTYGGRNGHRRNGGVRFEGGKAHQVNGGSAGPRAGGRRGHIPNSPA
jgi:5-methylcytosine-specific restriction endonuclease McrA